MRSHLSARRLWLNSGIGLLLLGALGWGLPALGAAPRDVPGATADAADPIRPAAACPSDLPTLVTGLLRDLPTYADLEAHRSLGNPAETEWPFGSVLLVSPPEFEPIDLADRTFQLPGAAAAEEPASTTAADFPSDSTAAPQQVFFTTLERQYIRGESVLLQHYHWLFLAPSDQGWQMAFIYSSVGPYPAGNRPPSPPQDSTDGVIGQAVGRWLRDCRAGSVHPVDIAPSAPGTGL